MSTDHDLLICHLSYTIQWNDRGIAAHLQTLSTSRSCLIFKQLVFCTHFMATANAKSSHLTPFPASPSTILESWTFGCITDDLPPLWIVFSCPHCLHQRYPCQHPDVFLPSSRPTCSSLWSCSWHGLRQFLSPSRFPVFL